MGSIKIVFCDHHHHLRYFLKKLTSFSKFPQNRLDRNWLTIDRRDFSFVRFSFLFVCLFFQI